MFRIMSTAWNLPAARACKQGQSESQNMIELNNKWNEKLKTLGVAELVGDDPCKMPIRIRRRNVEDAFDEFKS